MVTTSRTNPAWPRLRIVAGPSSGSELPIAQGITVIGRAPAAAPGLRGEAYLILLDSDISRRHAELRRTGDVVMLTDLGSTNGTLVNGAPLRVPAALLPGDRVRIGSAELVYELSRAVSAPIPGWPSYSDDGRATADQWAPAPPGPDRAGHGMKGAGPVRLGRVVLIAGIVEVIGLAVEAAITFFAGRALGAPAWLLTAVAAMGAGMIKALAEAAGGESGAAAETGARPVRRRGVSIPIALFVVVLIGLAGYGAAVGVRYGVGYATGHEDAKSAERLVGTARPTGSSGKVSVTVTGLVDTAHFTRVTVRVNNGESIAAKLSLFDNCVFTAGGVTLAADSFRSDFVEDVAPGSTQQGSISFPGHLPTDPLTGQLSFLHIFVFGRFGVNDAIVIRKIPLGPSVAD
jgi:hypothetical protein